MHKRHKIETMSNNSEKLGFFCLLRKFSFCLEVRYLLSGAPHNQAAGSQAVIEQLIHALFGGMRENEEYEPNPAVKGCRIWDVEYMLRYWYLA